MFPGASVQMINTDDLEVLMANGNMKIFFSIILFCTQCEQYVLAFSSYIANLLSLMTWLRSKQESRKGEVTPPEVCVFPPIPFSNDFYNVLIDIVMH